jgi:predicted transcriptional regulator
MWKQAINDLASYGMLADRGYKGEVFELTGKGFEVADLLQKNAGG